MARVNLKKDDVITKIIINVNINGKLYKDICLEYEEDADWKLTWEDIHYEDNDSCCFGEVGDNIIDFHIHGQDDELGMKNRLSMHGSFMDVDGINYRHRNEWIYSNSISNVRIFTKSGKMKRIRLLKESIREDKAWRINNGASLIQVKKKGE